MKRRKIASAFLCATLMMSQSLAPLATANAAGLSKETNASAEKAQGASGESKYAKRFNELYDLIKDPATGYFDENGVPYHSIEKLMIEAPDYGHESTSEAASYLVWLEAVKGRISGDYSGVSSAWDVINKYFIPTTDLQPTSQYNASSPATFANEYDTPSGYPSALQNSVRAGQDPIANELQQTYSTWTLYGMHWLVDVDNFYGYGGSDYEDPVYINTFQRGAMEGCWNTIPQPSIETFEYGGQYGFLPYFTAQDGAQAQQWRYTIASDADARVIQAMYRAKEWAEEDGTTVSNVDNTKKLGDYLRYSMYDKYFLKMGTQSKKEAGNGKDSAMYILNWYYAWGGAMDGAWSWRIGSSHAHFGYQNPFAALVMSDQQYGLVPSSSTAQADWNTSYERQLEFYQWLQSAEGAIAGGATNSLGGQYKDYGNISTFYGMAYQEHPVYSNPGSNQWIGMQCWSMQRIAEVYYETGDERAKKLLDKWANWIEGTLHMDSDDEWLPATLEWSGQPGTWNETTKSSDNSNLHVTVSAWGHDIGISASLANTLTYYAAGLKEHSSDEYESHVKIAKQLLDKIELYADDKGYGDVQHWDLDKIKLFYTNYYESADGSVVKGVYVPENYQDGVMGRGEAIKREDGTEGTSFYAIRKNAFSLEVDKEKASGIKASDPDTLAYCMDKMDLANAGANPEEFDINYHRFWANAEAAIAYGVMDEFFPVDGAETEEPTTEAATTQAPTTEAATTAAPTTQQPTTVAPTTERATTQAPTTEQQATVAPTTQQQATTAPTTEKVTTQAPTTEQQATAAPTTQQQATTAPTTEKVTTQAPTTEQVTTQAPTTEDTTVHVTGVTVDPEAFTLEVGQQKALNAKVTPENAAVNSVTWKSENENIATVNNAGVVTAVAPGTAKITVTTVDGNYKATCTITVVKGSVAVESVTFDKDNVSLKVGESDTVTATVAPADADNKTLTWVSSDESVATVNNGVIKAVKEGTAIVTAFTGNGKSVSCTVYVTSKTINVEGVTFDMETSELVEGEELTLKATVTPANASNQKVTWSSSDSTVVSVDANGNVKAVKPGTATITVKTEDGNFSSSCQITVVSKNTNIPVTGITLKQEELNLVAGGTGKIDVTISPANATNTGLTWSSSDSNVATVDGNGNVTAVKAGTAIIFVTATDGNYTETCKVVVTDSKVSVLGVELDQTSISLAEGAKTALTATVSPNNATDKAVVWTSSDSSVAVVDSYGNVTAVKAGTATITVITSDGAKQAACTVTVTANSILIESIQLNKNETTLTVGQKETLTASVTPSNVTNDQVVWSSSDETIATVSNGVVTAVKTGTAYITAKSLHGSCVDVCKVVVTNSGVAVEKIEITQPEINIEAGKTTQITLKVEPSNATVEDLVYSSSDESVVKVDANGKVTAVGPGTAIITVTTKDGKLTTNSQVTVTGGGTSSSDVVDVTDITLPEEGTTVNMTAGDSKQFNAQVVPVNATNQTLFWASSNTAVVDFANSTVGLAKAKSSGTATITVTSADGKQKASFTIKVEAASTTTPDPGESDGTVAVTGITLSATEVSIAAGRTYKLSATVTPANATNKGVRFISLNKSIATIDDTGMITAKAAGDVVIMVLTEKGEFIQCCEVTVTAEGSEPTNPTVNGSIKLSASQATMIPKQQVQLTATVQNLTNKNVTWSSMNPAVATVDANGTVTAVAAGATTILAKSADGTVSAACKIDVKAAATSTLKYEVTKFTATRKEVCVAGVAKNTVKTVKIPKTVKFYGVTYKVTSIKAKAFKSNKKITKVTIGQNVNKIGKQAFYGCSKVKTMSIKTTKLTSKKVGSKAFSKMKSTIKVTVPKSKKSSYKKLLKSKGIGSKAVIK